jgi:alpha-beta hydrolase superfamily lysophospholipase
MWVALAVVVSRSNPDSSLGRSFVTRTRGSASIARTIALASADGTLLHASLFPSRYPGAGLLLVHGLQSHAAWFEVSDTARELADAGITSLAYDRRGSGRSAGVTGHAESADDFLIDLEAAASALRRELPAGAPLHALANCFGTRIVLPYAAEHPGAFRSLILTAPATHMTRHASYSFRQKLSIALAASQTLVPTPLRDEDFVSPGPWLDWIRRDPLALRSVTAGFLRSAQRLTRRMETAIPRLRVPLLVVLSRRDVLVENEAIRRSFVGSYAGPKRLLEYDTDHYVDFTNARPEFERELEAWLLEQGP